MRGCLVLVLGFVIGVLALLVVQVFVIKPPVPRAGAQPAGDIQIVFRNAYMTREVNAGMQQLQGPTPFQDVTVNGTNEQNIQMNGYFLLNGQRVPTQVTLKPIAQNGRVAVQVVGTQLGVLRLPPQVIASVQQSINDNLARALGSASFKVVGASASDQGMIVEVTVGS